VESWDKNLTSGLHMGSSMKAEGKSERYLEDGKTRTRIESRPPVSRRINVGESSNLKRAHLSCADESTTMHDNTLRSIKKVSTNLDSDDCNEVLIY